MSKFIFGNIGKRVAATERGTSFNYVARALNQYASINSARRPRPIRAPERP